MRAALDDPAVLEHQDQVGVADRAQAVGDHDAGAAGEQRRQRGLDRSPRCGCRRCAVASSRIRMRGSASTARAKASSWRWPWLSVAAALAERGVVALGQRGDEVVRVDRARGRLDLLARWRRAGRRRCCRRSCR